MNRAAYIMIGGFLGAGKSTTVGRLARFVTDRGKSVGLITNDQGSGLVDTRSLRHQGFAVEEIAGGCFCCRFDSLKDAAAKLDSASRPDVFLAEPVGSCTDLVATVSYPLRRLYGDRYSIAPLSVVLDPVRAGRVLELRPGRKFSNKVTYVYRKQLEEAQILVINKRDLLSDDEAQDLRQALETQYPGRRIFEVSARENEGLEPWFEALLAEEAPDEATMDIDYQLYGEGEALLGWLNATLRLESQRELDGNAWLHDLAARFQERLMALGAEVAHLKMTLAPSGAMKDLALVNLVNLDFVPEVGERLQAPLRRGQLVVNLRAEAAPEVLRQCLQEAVEATAEGAAPSSSGQGGVQLTLEHVESFRPGQPTPVHRDATPPHRATSREGLS